MRASDVVIATAHSGAQTQTLSIPVVPLSQQPPLSNMRLWLKADTGLTVGSVSYWPDQSGIANRGAAQVTVSAQPVLVANALNGRPVVHFSGGQRLALPANLMDGASAGEGFVVLKMATDNSDQGFWNLGPPGSPQRYTNGSGNIEEDFGSNSFYTVGKPGLPLTQYHLYGVLAKAGLWQMRQNGRVFYTANANSVGFRPDPVLGAGYPDGQAALQGDIAEVIIYDRALTDAEREAVGQYLAAKYALVSAPAAPTNLTAVALSNTQVSLAWTNDPGNGVQFYEVERQAAGESGFALVATVADGMGYQDNTAVAGTAYTYRIRMRNYAGTSGYSNEASATTPTTMANGVPNTGLRLWLKADAGLTVGSVPYWPDQSGVASRGAAQVTVSAQPVLVANALNGRPVVHFSGGQRLALPANLMDGASAGEGFVVLKMATDNSNQGFWNLGPPGSPQRYTNGSGNIEEDFGSNAIYTVGKPGLPLTQYHLYGVLAKTGLWQMRQNGRVFYTANANSVGFRPDPVLGAGYPDGQAALQGDIAEVIIYDRALTDAEREAVGQYLAAKYALVSAPAAPTNLTAVALSNTQVSLAWTNDPGNGVQFYEVERKAAGESGFASMATVADGMGYQDNTAVPGTAYTYRIRMRNYAGTSGYSNEASATTPTTMANGVPNTGLRLWLKADAGLTVGSVPYWPDQSGVASRGAAQVTVSAQPVLVANALNGRPVVHFSGGQRLALPANLMDGASAGEGFVVLKMATDNSNQGFWNLGPPGSPQRYTNGSGNIEEDFGSNAIYTVGKPGLPLTQYHLYGVLAKTGLWQMRQNGRVFYTANANSVGFRPDPVLGAGYPDGQAALQGDIAEVIIYDRALSDAEREAVGQYLAAKYAFVAVPAAPTNLTAVALSNTQVSLAWTNDPGNGVQFYEVERKAAGESGFASVATVADGMGYQDNTAVAGTAYTYRIRMRNYAGTSGYSNEANATTPTTKANGVPSTGLRLWLKADAGLTVGSVPYWPDQSGVASRGAAQVTVSAQPVLVANALNGRPVVHFSGGQRLALPANLMDGASAGEGFVVLKMATDNSDQGFWNLGPPGSPQRYTNGSGYIEEDFGSNANYTVAKPGLPLTQYHLYGVLAKAGLVQMRQNGRVFYTANANTVGFRPDPVLGAGYPDGQAALQGDIAEVIIYDRALGDAEREAVGRYLTAKYAFVSAPAAPTNLTAVALNNTQISLAWSNDPGNGVQFYEVERKAAGESVFASVATVSDGMGYQDNTAVPGTAYTYRIRMRNYAGTSGYSNEASATTPTTKANGVPTTGLRLWLKADAGLTVGSVPYWPDQSGIASRGAAQVTVSAQPALVTNALNGRPVVHFSGGQRLALPANLMDGASEGEGFVVLKVATENSNLGFWNVGSAGWVQRYANGSGSIEEDFGSNSYYAVAKPGLPLTQYHLYGVLAKTRLWQMRQNGRVFNTANANTVGFRPDPVLGAGYPDGQAALRGDIAEVIIYDRALTDAEREAVGQYISAKYAFILPPVTPTNLTAVPLSDTQVSLAWTNDPGNAVQFYEVQRQTGSGDFATVGEANDQQSYQDSGLSPGTIYSYRIKARDYAGSSDYSNVASAKTMPPAPTHLIASATSVTQVKLSWFDPSLESGLIYTLERQTGSTGFQVVTEIAGDLGYSDIGLAPNTTYSYRIKARNSSGSSLYSSLITVTTWRLPLPAPETGMRLWLSAESVVAGPSGVQVWPDLSGNGNDAIQDSSSNQPQLIANQLNGRAIVRFDGASSYLNLPNVMNGATAGDIFVVLRAQAANGADCRLYSMSGRLQYPAVDGQISDSFGSSTDHAVGSPGVDITQPHIYNATSANDQWTARIDLATLCTTATNVVSMGDGSSAPVLGADYSGPSATLANWFAGDVAEIIVYDHVLTDTERRNLQQLLAAKYGLPISFPGDSDNNALPDAWETQYFGQIGIDPNASNSGDGQTNYQKYLAGINPLDFYHGRALAITLDTAGNFYTYDASGRLSGASYPSGMTLQVGSDAAGNLVTFSGSGAIVQWRAAHNLPADGTGQGADNAIVANDGLPNLAKYAFGLDPAVPVTTDCPTVTLTRLGGSSYLTMTYLRPDPAPPELVYKVEVSTDGTTWAVNGTVDLGTAVNNGMATVVVRDATPVNWPNFGRRIRLAIERKARP